MFVDEAEIKVQAGDGGHGAVSLRREKHVPRGGPDGGDGGRGGDVVALGDAHLRTLIDVVYRTHYRAEDGGPGGSNMRRGKTGRNEVIRLPLGTIIRDAHDESLRAEILYSGQRVLVAQGGRGGRGNASFATATRRTPRFAERGEPGERRRLRLELKLLADVGVVGMPNVGKSSLIARVSSARPKIADYAFTTLIPNLAVVRIEEGLSFVIADLPGLVEGAHRGAGRGHEFLRHAERTRVFIHMLDAGTPDRDPLSDFEVVSREIALYREDLAERPQVVALNKMDLRPPAEWVDRIEAGLRERGHEVVRISALTGEGVMALLGRAAQHLGTAPEEVPATPPEHTALRRSRRGTRVDRTAEGRFEVSGDAIERIIAMTDLDNEEAVRHLHRRLERMGVIARLRGLGAKDGDHVRIGGVELDFVD